MERTTRSLQETKQYAGEIVSNFQNNATAREKAVVVALYGDLGSGKTSFTQGAAEALGIAQTVISPTFVIERVYELSGMPWARFIHIDCYRFESAEELRTLGWDDLSGDPLNIIFIEWAGKVEKFLPKNTTKIYFSFIDENTRKIKTSI